MSSDIDEPEGCFAIYFAEGEILAKQGQYTKAIDSYSKALDMQEEDKGCLVARSKCYLKLGNTTLALQDAEDSLKENKEYHKGLHQKAEVLYQMGDFERALMFYHRGRKIRPELEEFVLGIQKAQEAVNNSIGTPESCKLEKIGDLSFFQQQDNIGKKKIKKLMKPGVVTQQKKERKPVASEKTIKELLGEMYADREYLDKLMTDPGLVIGRKDHSIYKEVEDALIYLDSRTEFWRQQKPMYARKREKELKRYKPSPTVPMPMGRLTSTKEGGSHHTKIILKSLEDIDTALANGDAENSLVKAEKLMKTVAALTEKDLPGKQEYVASLHSCIGNAHLEMGEAELALENHLKDLAIAEKIKQSEMLSRALDNVGRVFAVMGKFRRASEYWTRKLPLVGSSEESAWLHHELGRCQLELGNYAEALTLGEKSLTEAKLAMDQMWELNGYMLMAQAQCRLNDFDPSVENFDKALALARILDDDATETAIVKAMEDVKEKIEASMGGKAPEKEEEGVEEGGAEGEQRKEGVEGVVEGGIGEEGVKEGGGEEAEGGGTVVKEGGVVDEDAKEEGMGGEDIKGTGDEDVKEEEAEGGEEGVVKEGEEVVVEEEGIEEGGEGSAGEADTEGEEKGEADTEGGGKGEADTEGEEKGEADTEGGGKGEADTEGEEKGEADTEGGGKGEADTEGGGKGEADTEGGEADTEGGDKGEEES